MCDHTNDAICFLAKMVMQRIVNRTIETVDQIPSAVAVHRRRGGVACVEGSGYRTLGNKPVADRGSDWKGCWGAGDLCC